MEQCGGGGGKSHWRLDAPDMTARAHGRATAGAGTGFGAGEYRVLGPRTRVEDVGSGRSRCDGEGYVCLQIAPAQAPGCTLGRTQRLLWDRGDGQRDIAAVCAEKPPLGLAVSQIHHGHSSLFRVLSSKPSFGYDPSFGCVNNSKLSVHLLHCKRLSADVLTEEHVARRPSVWAHGGLQGKVRLSYPAWRSAFRMRCTLAETSSCPLRARCSTHDRGECAPANRQTDGSRNLRSSRNWAVGFRRGCPRT
eukprot:1186245-Prorocentrum_minimum.AAC.3